MHYRPDGKKKAYVRLTTDHDALDVANKVREKVVVFDPFLMNGGADWVYLVVYGLICCTGNAMDMIE